MARQQFRYQKKEKLWVGLGSSLHSFTVSAIQVGSGFLFTSSQTVLRILGGYSIQPTTAPTAGTRCEIGIGIGLFSSDAFALGATAMPEPISEEGFPWLFWVNHFVRYPDAVLDPSVAGASINRSIDIRSMRKFKSNQTLGVVVQYLDSNGTPDTTVTMDGMRVLTTLH